MEECYLDFEDEGVIFIPSVEKEEKQEEKVIEDNVMTNSENDKDSKTIAKKGDLTFFQRIIEWVKALI